MLRCPSTLACMSGGPMNWSLYSSTMAPAAPPPEHARGGEIAPYAGPLQQSFLLYHRKERRPRRGRGAGVE
jgi:hypothetical protein